MISRVWHGYTSSGNAEAYEALLKSEIFAGIAARGIAGYKGSSSSGATWVRRSSSSP